MSEIDAVLAHLSDGRWHNLLKMTTTLQIDQLKLERVVSLLAEFSFVSMNEQNVQISSDTKDFLESTSKDEL